MSSGRRRRTTKRCAKTPETTQCKALFFNRKNRVLTNRLLLRRSGCALVSRMAHPTRNDVVGSRERLQHLTRMLFSCPPDEVPGGLVLLEFDADQRLWQETVRDAVTKQCPPTLVRSIAEDGVDPGPLVEDLRGRGLDGADRPGERRRTGDRARGAGPCHRSDAVSGHDDPVRPPGGRPLRPAAGWHRRIRRRDGPSRRRRLGAERNGPSRARRRPGREARGRHRCRRVPHRRERGGRQAQPGLRSGAAHRRRLVRRRACARHRPRQRRRRAGPPRRADRHGDHHCRRLPAHPRPRPRTCEAAPAVRCRDRLVSGRPAQGRRHARRHRARPCTLVLRRADHRRRRSPQAAGRGDGQGLCGRGSVGGVPPRPAAVRRHGLHVGERSSVRAETGQGRRAAAGRRRRTSRDDRGGIQGFDAADF